MTIHYTTCGELAKLCSTATAADFAISEDFPTHDGTPCMVIVDEDRMIREYALGHDASKVDQWQDIGEPVCLPE